MSFILNAALRLQSVYFTANHVISLSPGSGRQDDRIWQTMCFYYKSTERKFSRYCWTPQTRYLDTVQHTFTFYLNHSLRHKTQQPKQLNISAFAGDQVLEWNGKLLQGATFKEVYNIILESKPEPQVELVVSRPLGWERRLNHTLLLNYGLNVFKPVMLWDWLLSINSEEPGQSSPTHSCPQATILNNWPYQPFYLERLRPKRE